MQKVEGQRVLLGATIIFVLAFVLRLFHIKAILAGSPFFDVLPGDLGAYDRWAVQIVEQGWVGQGVFYQDPLYPYFLAVLYKLVGRDFFWIYTIQAFLGAWTALLLVLLGNKVFSRGAGILAGLLYALYTPAIYFDGLLLKVTLAAFLFTQAIYFFLHNDMREISPSSYFSGFFLGLACLVRANFLLILPLQLIATLIYPNAKLVKRFAMAVLLLIGVLSALLPVIARNYVVGRELVLTTAQAGQNFYIGHNPEADGTYIRLPFVRPDPLYEQEDFHAEAEKRAGKELSAAEASRYWLQQGIDYIKSNPWADLKLTARKLLLFINSYEIPDNHNFYFHQRYSRVLRDLPVNFGLVAPFFLLGLLGMLLEKRAAPVFLFWVQLIYILSVVMFFVFSRYRMGGMPLICLSAGYGISMLLNQGRMGQWRKFLASVLLVGFAFVAVKRQVIEPFDFSHSFTDEGIAYEMKDEGQKAHQSYLQALDINPEYLRALERLGKLLMHRKEYTEARAIYKRILALEPDSVEAKYQIMFLDKMGL